MPEVVLGDGVRVTVTSPGQAAFRSAAAPVDVAVNAPAINRVRIGTPEMPAFLPEVPDPRTVLVPARGPAGPEGREGPRGPAGDGGGTVHRSYGFAVPDTLWRIRHDLNTVSLLVELYDTNGDELEANIRIVDADTVEVDWYYPTAGEARLFT